MQEKTAEVHAVRTNRFPSRQTAGRKKNEQADQKEEAKAQEQAACSKCGGRHDNNRSSAYNKISVICKKLPLVKLVQERPIDAMV